MALAQPTSAERACFVTRHESSIFVQCFYDEVHELGRGSFGRVVLVKERATGQHRVCKVVNIKGMDHFNVELARCEIRLLCELDHPRIVRLYEYAEDFARQELVLILEYLPGGDCTRLLKNGGRPAEALASQVIFQAMVAVGHCHERGIIHRDVKLENFMFGGVSARGMADCKLIDFGFATRASGSEILGTAQYIAPEVLRGEGFTPAVDVWAMGVCVFELLTGFCPFGKPDDYDGRMEPVIERIGRYRDFGELSCLLESSQGWAECSEAAKDFAGWLLAADGRDRPSIAEALQHPWLQQHGHKATLGSSLLDSLANYANAPPITQSCLYVIAARTDVPQIKQFGDVFLSLDVDGDGKVSRDELSDAVGGAGHWWAPRIDAQRLFDAMDLDKSGSLNFTKFAAACLYSSYTSVDDVLASAFAALDVARRGALSVRDIVHLFPQCDSPMLRHLPQHQMFGADEWVAYFAVSCSLKVVAAPPKRVKQPVGFFDRFFCAKPSHCSVRDAEYIVEKCGSPIGTPHRPIACF